MAEARLRPAVLADAPALGATHVACWQESYRGIVADGYLDRMSVQRRTGIWRRALLVPRPGVSILVLEDDEGLAGFGMGGPQREDDRTADAEISALYLRQRRQGEGWGRALMQALAAEAQRWGAGSLDLWVLAGNVRAVRFYERLGGVPGETRRFRIARRPLTERAFSWPRLRNLTAPRSHG
jgi:GNAT superfamily N-acetyltransferase